MSRPQPAPRDSFAIFYELPTRWADNDIYGHANNVVYYAWFDTVVNRYLIEEGGLKPLTAEVVGFVVASSCDYFAPVEHPSTLQLGLRIERLGSKSVTWEVGVLLPGDQTSRATGRFTHAFVERASNTSAEIPVDIRAALEKLL